MKQISILGTGCAKCHNLAEQVEAAAKAMGLDYRIEKVTDLQEMMRYGVMTTPALVVDGQVKAVGKVLSAEEIKKLLA